MAGIGNVPLLYSFNTSHGVPVFVSAVKISDLIKHRYAPRDHWRAVWDYVLQVVNLYNYPLIVLQLTSNCVTIHL
eukprot:COSAG04_NODE_131_length_24280_cov_40.563418_6_plen_75_part_00